MLGLFVFCCTLGGRTAAGAGGEEIGGGAVARYKSCAILSRAFLVASPESRKGRVLGGFCRIATISSAAWRRRSSVFTDGNGT